MAQSLNLFSKKSAGQYPNFYNLRNPKHSKNPVATSDNGAENFLISHHLTFPSSISGKVSGSKVTINNLQSCNHNQSNVYFL